LTQCCLANAVFIKQHNIIDVQKNMGLSLFLNTNVLCSFGKWGTLGDIMQRNDYSWTVYTTLIADFADAAIDRGHCHHGRLSFGRSPSLPRVHVRDDRVE